MIPRWRCVDANATLRHLGIISITNLGKNHFIPLIRTVFLDNNCCFALLPEKEEEEKWLTSVI